MQSEAIDPKIEDTIADGAGKAGDINFVAVKDSCAHVNASERTTFDRDLTGARRCSVGDVDFIEVRFVPHPEIEPVPERP